jgi:cytochrome c
MKKTIAILGVCCVIFACGGNNSGNTEEKSIGTSTNVGSEDQSAIVAVGSEKGNQLINASDCLSCHNIGTKIVGPSYIEVANKYVSTEANIAMLAGKIIEGGAGNWGEIPMSPHPNISTEDAKEMIKYILSLKTN